MMNTFPEMDVVGTLPFDTELIAEAILGQGEAPCGGQALSPNSPMLAIQSVLLLLLWLLLFF